jgi:hypothetical protein
MPSRERDLNESAGRVIMNTRSIAYAVSASVIAIALMGCEGGRDSENQAVAEEPASRGAARSASALSAERIETPEQLDQLVEQIKELPADEQRRALSALQFSPFIVGGEEVPIANHPWQVALLRGQQTDRSQFCGGSLVAPDTVVTAAHCIDSWFVQKDPARVDVLIGTANTQQGGERSRFDQSPFTRVGTAEITTMTWRSSVSRLPRLRDEPSQFIRTS